MSDFELPAELMNELVHPDIHTLFQHYSDVYFNGDLGHCSVEWSSGRMTSCAGTCQFKSGGGCIIRLSEPILKLRPPEDLKNTLIHEMIHAYIFLKRIPGAGNDGHGPPFKAIMKQINESTVPDFHRPAEGYKITVYHTMIDEVRHYQQHWWECERCKDVIKRATNRKPQEADCFTRQGAACNHPKCRYHTHLRTCGGAYIKVKEPEPKVKERKRPAKKTPGGLKQSKGQGTLSDAFTKTAAKQQREQDSAFRQEPEGRTAFDTLDEAIDVTPWLGPTSHGATLPVKSDHGCPPPSSMSALKKNLVNLLDPLVPCEHLSVVARGGGASTGGPSPADSIGAGKASGPARQGSGKQDQGCVLDLTDDASDHVQVSQVLRAAVKRKMPLAECTEGASVQISLLSDSEDEADQNIAVGSSSHGVKVGPSPGTATAAEQADRRSPGTKMQKVVECEPGVGVNRQDVDSNAGLDDTARAGKSADESGEIARRRALCAAAAAARLLGTKPDNFDLVSNESDPPDRKPD